MKKLIFLTSFLLFVSVSFSQVNRTFKLVKADSLTERQTGTGITLRHSKLVSPKVNDSTIQLYVETHSKSVSPAIIHDSLTSFGLLKSKSSLVSIDDPTATVPGVILKVDPVSYPDILQVYDDLLTGICYTLQADGLTLSNSSYGFFTFKDNGGTPSFGVYQNGAGTNAAGKYFLIPNRTCSLTDGIPTAAELGSCGIVTTGSARSVQIVHDSDGTQLDYLVTYNGTSYYYVVLTLAL